jgi:hypothetical protein
MLYIFNLQYINEQKFYANTNNFLSREFLDFDQTEPKHVAMK